MVQTAPAGAQKTVPAAPVSTMNVRWEDVRKCPADFPQGDQKKKKPFNFGFVNLAYMRIFNGGIPSTA